VCLRDDTAVVARNVTQIGTFINAYAPRRISAGPPVGLKLVFSAHQSSIFNQEGPTISVVEQQHEVPLAAGHSRAL
jgi:hypothetical protein